MATIRDILPTLSEFARYDAFDDSDFSSDILDLDEESGCGKDCVRVLKLADLLLAEMQDINNEAWDTITRAVVQQINVFYYG
jgi:hypothetical protein